MSKEIRFHKVRETECDFCGCFRPVVTAVNETTYICADCAVEAIRLLDAYTATTKIHLVDDVDRVVDWTPYYMLTGEKEN